MAIPVAPSVGERVEMVGLVKSPVVKFQVVEAEIPAKLLLEVSSKAVAST